MELAGTDQRSVLIHWSQLARECENGHELRYEITMFEAQGRLQYIYMFTSFIFTHVVL